MSHYALIENGKVREVREFESIEGRFHPSLNWVECPQSVGQEWEYDNNTGEFSQPTEQSVTLSEAKTQLVQEFKLQANSILSETDWYVVRKQETGESIPQTVIDHRAEVRSLSDQFESDVNALESVSDVQEYSFDYPKPPEP